MQPEHQQQNEEFYPSNVDNFIFYWKPENEANPVEYIYKEDHSILDCSVDFLGSVEASEGSFDDSVV